MAELGFRSVSKITRPDWLLIFYEIGPTGPIRYLLRTGIFWRENLRADFNEIEGN